ncbi:hypothetical protein C8R44DRAFT_883805 [Mycena epipterygia]|nr:hypothetical protein C8R44DRAFT_883805 [Mycena epipterygia]
MLETSAMWVDNKDSIDLTSFAANQLLTLAFFFGGVGDARHVFGTLISLHDTSYRLNENQRDALNVHITLLDIKEHALARDLVVMFLLSKIMVCDDATERLELQATVFYIYTTLVMPKYCQERFCDAVAEIQVKISQDAVNFLPWIRLDSRSVPKIMSVLSLWASLPEKLTSNFVSQHQYSPRPNDNGPFQLLDESKWYAQVKTFLPPAELWDRHPEFLSL